MPPENLAEKVGKFYEAVEKIANFMRTDNGKDYVRTEALPFYDEQNIPNINKGFSLKFTLIREETDPRTTLRMYDGKVYEVDPKVVALVKKIAELAKEYFKPTQIFVEPWKVTPEYVEMDVDVSYEPIPVLEQEK